MSKGSCFPRIGVEAVRGLGRVHRLGGIRKKGEKVVVIYCYQTGTYEETMVARVQERCRMMRALLGAGQWLRDEIEIREMDRYPMTFPPDGDRPPTR